MNSPLSDAIAAVMQLLYGSATQELLKEHLDFLETQFSDESLNLAIEKLRRADLVAASYSRGTIRKTVPGLEAFAKGTFLALSLGKEYIRISSVQAVMHLVVKGKRKEQTGGVAFCCEDAGRRLVTAAHLVVDREILQIENDQGVLYRSPIKIFKTIRDLDLAILDVIAPEGTSCLRIEWDKEKISQLSTVYVIGFPQVPQQSMVSMIFRTAQLEGISQDYARRTTYLISHVTSPGFSGGPAINERGRVIGIVQGVPMNPLSTDLFERRNISEEQAQGEQIHLQEYDAGYSVLTPAWYIDELIDLK